MFAVLLVTVLSTALITRHAAALVREREQAVVDTLLRYANSQYFGETQTVGINGLTFKLDVGTTTDTVAAVLSWYAAGCRAVAARPDGDFASLLRRFPELDALWNKSLLRREHEHAGYLACFDADASRVDLASLKAKLEAFSRDTDPSIFGNLRYIAASRRGATTTYVAIRSVGELPLRAAFPARGDAPGSDTHCGPRPARSRRLLTAASSASPSAVRAYEVRPSASGACADAYVRALGAAGMHVTPTRRAPATWAFHAVGDSCELDVTASESPGGTTLFTVISSQRATTLAQRR